MKNKINVHNVVHRMIYYVNKAGCIMLCSYNIIEIIILEANIPWWLLYTLSGHIREFHVIILSVKSKPKSEIFLTVTSILLFDVLKTITNENGVGVKSRGYFEVFTLAQGAKIENVC